MWVCAMRGMVALLSLVLYSQPVYSQSSKGETDKKSGESNPEQTKPQQNTPPVVQNTFDLKSISVAERYFLFQQANQPATRNSNTSQFKLSDGSVVSLNPQTIRDAVEQDGTYQPIGAVFDLLGSFGSAGSGSIPSAQSGIQTQAFGGINWESQHYGYHNKITAAKPDYDKNLDFSFGGTIGLYPALVLENLTGDTQAISQTKARPMFQDAFRWTLGGNVNLPVFSHGEGTVFVTFGQNFLINEVSSFKQGDSTVTATPVSNGVGRAAAFLEGGVQFKILASPIWVAHDDKISNLSPLMMAAVGIRKDTRFSRSGDLTQFNNPQGRVFFRFSLSLTKILSITDVAKSASPASMRFGVDLERPMTDQRIPMAIRFFVSADADILKIFRPSTTK